MTTVAEQLRPLRAELRRAREEHGRRSTPALQAFNNLFKTAARLGQPLDSLRKYATDEVERFFAQTIPGPDGHIYWDGPREFRRNDGKVRVPRRWWYAHKNGAELGAYDDLVPTCGQRNCINPDHCEVGRDVARQRQFKDHQIIGALQVAAERLGHSPTKAEWKTLGARPNGTTVVYRFGSWEKAIVAAGLPPAPPASSLFAVVYGETEILAALRFVANLAERVPSEKTYRKYRAELRAAGLPTAPETVRRMYGSWPVAVRKAGLIT